MAIIIIGSSLLPAVLKLNVMTTGIVAVIAATVAAIYLLAVSGKKENNNILKEEKNNSLNEVETVKVIEKEIAVDNDNIVNKHKKAEIEKLAVFQEERVEDLNNLINENQYTFISINNFSYYQSVIQLVPRYVLGTIKYRF